MNTTTTDTVRITRIINAPRDIVFKAWIDSKQLALWWGPKNFTNPVCELDVRVGGSILIHMQSPDGTVFPMTGVFNEIVEPERLVFTSQAMDNNNKLMFEVLTTVEFIEREGKTELLLTAGAFNVKLEAAPYLSGMEEGWSMSLEKLKELVGKG